MKRISILLAGLLAVFLISGPVMAMPVVNGTFTTFSEWAGHYADDDGVASDGFVDPGWGGQSYDVEYLGLYFDADTLYFGLQTGFDLVNGTSSYLPGDFALDINGDGQYDYAIDYSVSGSDVTYYLVDMSNASAYWVDTVISGWSGEASPWQATYDADDYVTFTAIDGYGSGVFDNNEDGGISHVLEGSFDMSLLSGYSGGDITLHWTMQCGNDYLDYTGSPVPEPASMLLLGAGLIGLAGFGKRKLRN